ncbi:MAG: MogA/MoaB family molybdenum cofactor biosynthesis protein [Nodosilinea sp. LVE1205-7]
MHPQPLPRPINCGVGTVSDSRTAATDTSGQLIQTLLQRAGHQVRDYRILPDVPEKITALCQVWAEEDQIDVIIFTGGTGIAPRDYTYEAIAGLLEKTLPGFGELFRSLSFQQVGSRAMASRAIAGIYGSTLVFSLPGSSRAVQLALEALILPELPHLVGLLRG